MQLIENRLEFKFTNLNAQFYVLLICIFGFMLVLKKIGFLTLFSAILGCSSGTWPETEQTKFKDECKAEGGSNSYCSCFLENVMTKYPNVSDVDQMEFETAVELSKDCE